MCVCVCGFSLTQTTLARNQIATNAHALHVLLQENINTLGGVKKEKKTGKCIPFEHLNLQEYF